MADFKGIPVSSKSAMQVPVTVVSQPSSKEIFDHAEAKTGNSEQKGVQSNTDQNESDRTREKEVNPALDDFMASSIVAIPRQIPTMLDVRCKDPEWRPRWVNWKSDEGRFLEEKKAMGFRLARPEEIIGLDPSSTMIKPEGIKYHDVVLMVIPTKILYGWYKHNAITSAARVSQRELHRNMNEQANKVLRQGITNEGYSFKDVADKIGIYIPSQSEQDKKGI